jgi:hypothetical protein
MRTIFAICSLVVVLFSAMARRPRPPDEVLSRKDLQELQRRLSKMSATDPCRSSDPSVFRKVKGTLKLLVADAADSDRRSPPSHYHTKITFFRLARHTRRRNQNSCA